MPIEFDPAKRAKNLEKHQIDLAGAEQLFEGDTLTIEDDRFDYGEQRFHHRRPAGRTDDGRRLDPARRGPSHPFHEESQ